MSTSSRCTSTHCAANWTSRPAGPASKRYAAPATGWSTMAGSARRRALRVPHPLGLIRAIRRRLASVRLRAALGAALAAAFILGAGDLGIREVVRHAWQKQALDDADMTAR